MGGITNIQWENRLGEISLIIAPRYQKKGIGTNAAILLFNEAFYQMNLKTVFGECYRCNPSVAFWEKITKRYDGYSTVLPNRKYWNGKFHDSYYFSVDANGFVQSSGKV